MTFTWKSAQPKIKQWLPWQLCRVAQFGLCCFHPSNWICWIIFHGLTGTWFIDYIIFMQDKCLSEYSLMLPGKSHMQCSVTQTDILYALERDTHTVFWLEGCMSARTDPRTYLLNTCSRINRWYKVWEERTKRKQSTSSKLRKSCFPPTHLQPDTKRKHVHSGWYRHKPFEAENYKW